jgi:hypothetical protein
MNLSIPLGYYATTTPTSGTTKPDVSDMLELWAHKETPFLNRISWGEESGAANLITWLTEHLGWRYFETSGAVATNATSLIIASLGAGYLTKVNQSKQIRPGTLCWAQGVADSGSASGDNAWFYVTTVGAAGTLDIAMIADNAASIAASSKIYIVGSFANEGSTPDRDTTRTRSILSNNLTILRYDIQMTGSQAKTDMYAVADELQHQTKLRLLEMQMDRERALLLSVAQAKSATVPPLMYGFLGLIAVPATFASGVADGWVDNTTTSLTETAFNNMVAACFENGGRPNCVVGAVSQIRKFTSWATDRIRSTPDNRVGGQYITQYMTDVGITVDLIPMMKWPVDMLFILDDSKFTMRAKKGRKLIIEKLGKSGDYDQWQLISEFSMEHHGVAWGQHGAFLKLA